MGYTDGEALLLTQVQNATGFSSTNAARGDWAMLRKGKDDCYAILKQGDSTEGEFVTFRIEAATWQCIIEVWQHYKDKSDYADLLTNVKNIKSRLILYPKIGDTTGVIRDAFIVSTSAIQEMWSKGGGLEWLRQDITFQWVEETNVTFSE